MGRISRQAANNLLELPHILACGSRLCRNSRNSWQKNVISGPQRDASTRLPNSTVQRGDGNPQGDYVLYWMIASRRTYWNFGLQRAAEWSNRLAKPLLIMEALRCGYQWASDRIHGFVIEGMRDNAARLQGTGAFYYPYLEPVPDAGKGLLRELAERACVVVTDDFPCFFLTRMVSSAASQVRVLLEKVDSTVFYRFAGQTSSSRQPSHSDVSCRTNLSPICTHYQCRTP